VDDLYESLAWLPRPPADFRSRCTAVRDAAGPAGATLRALAAYALDENGLKRLAGVLEAARGAGRALEPLTPFRLGIIGNGTLKQLAPAFTGSAVRHGIALECVTAEYGQTLQEALAPDSAVNRTRPDAVLIALDYRGLPLSPDVADDEESAERAIGDTVAFVEALCAGFRRNASAPCILQTIACPPESLFGSFERSVRGTLRARIDETNRRLAVAAQAAGDAILDVAALAETVGTSSWFSPTQWNLGKFGFDGRFLPLYADHVARIVGALRGKARKCLVLDLDNTLWSGVIGDDGVAGIVLGQGDATGEAHLELQRAALALRARGVILAVSSKNEDDAARSPFRLHAEMLLREDHIAVFQANWSDKATNLAAIARELAIGTDSLVFVDDNPVERELVRTTLPEVAVPELPGDPALYARTLLAAGYFEAVSFSAEDRARAGYYQQNARRAALREQIADLDSYLASLRMTISFRPFDEAGRARIAQLINKSNQFNLTTRRYTETEVAATERDAALTLQVRLADAFDDNGMISVVICRSRSGTAWEIDTWLMSCRVLGRRVEQMVLREILLAARARGIERVVGVYRPTEKNRMVEDHYQRLGFTLVERGGDGTTVWEIDARTDVPEAPMTVERVEASPVA
jgi:FkbH-like protein